MLTQFQHTGGLASFITGYMECALWSSTDDNDVPLDTHYGVEDIAVGSLASMEADCEDFVKAYPFLLEDWNASQAGHDFWLTRNHHGAGFWDRGKATGDALTKQAHVYGESCLYVGDDDKVYIL